VSEHGCQACGAPLAADQRWCLECGARRAEARIPFLEILAPASVAGPAVAAPGAGAARGGGWREFFTPRVAGATVVAVFVSGWLLGGALGPGPLDSAANDAIVVAQQAPQAATGPLSDSPPTAEAGGGELPEESGDVGACCEGDEEPLASDAGLGDFTSGGDTGGGGILPPDTTDPGNTDTDPAQGEQKPPVDRVFVLALGAGAFAESAQAGEARTSAAPSYLDGDLRRRGQFLPNYHAVAHGGLAGRIALISGQPPNPATAAECSAYTDLLPGTLDRDGRAEGEGCVYPSNVLTIGDQLVTIGLKWGAYVEGMGDAAAEPKTCRHPALGALDPTALLRPGDGYATRHNPFVYFHSIIDSPDCAKSAQGLDRLAEDLRDAKQAPDFVWVSPSACNAGDAPVVGCPRGGREAGDAFARTWVPRILDSPAFEQGNGLLVVTFDEGPPTDVRTCCGLAPPGGGRVGAVVVSRFVRAGSVNQAAYNHYGLLRTAQDLFGLGTLGLSQKAKPFGRDVFAETS
jgi:phosphatidylinositol-3-phosphatase